MKKCLIIFAILLTLPQMVFANEFMLSFGGFKSHSNLIGQEDPPTYQGYGYVGEVEYLMPVTDSVAFSFFGIASKSDAENISDSEIKENLELKYLGLGAKIYFSNTFFSFSLGKVSFDLEASGEIEKTITAEETGYEMGIGHRFKLTTLTGIVVSLHALHSNLNPENGTGFYKDYDLWQYRGTIALNFILPSGVEE